MKKVSEKDMRKMIIFSDNDGWSNVNVEVTEHEIVITCDTNEIFSSDE